MKPAFIQYTTAKKKRQLREKTKYNLAVLQDVKEGRSMACKLIDCSWMKRGKPLNLEEVKDLADKWFPIFDEVHSRLPDWASVEDTLKVMEHLSKLAGAEIAEKEKNETKFFYRDHASLWRLLTVDF